MQIPNPSVIEALLYFVYWPPRITAFESLNSLLNSKSLRSLGGVQISAGRKGFDLHTLEKSTCALKHVCLINPPPHSECYIPLLCNLLKMQGGTWEMEISFCSKNFSIFSDILGYKQILRGSYRKLSKTGRVSQYS